MGEEALIEAFRRLRGRWKADDALQEAFCRLWSRKVFPGNVSEAEGMLYVTRRNIVIDEYRRKKKMSFLPLTDNFAEDGTHSAMDKEILFRKVESLLEERITPLQKDIIRMHEYESIPLNEIAEKLGMQPSAVRMQISRARKTLRDLYFERYGQD